MAFLGKRNVFDAPAPDGKKSRLTIGSLFNPNIGATLRPLGETGKMLVTIIAAIFAANGLFPRNHPALHNVAGARLTLTEVLSVGWQNVTFTRETLPRTLIFFAVILSLGFSVLILVAGLMHLLIGTAHAQCAGPSCFVSPGDTAGTDIATNWMNWLFFGMPMSDANMLNTITDPITGLNHQVFPVGTGDSGGGTNIQGAIIYALGLYSYCMLIIGGFILFYHVATMVFETGHHGVFFGRRANQIWAPFRLVAAIVILIPISTVGLGSGLNTGQYVVLQVAKWGSGLASNVWGYFLAKLTTDTFAFVPPIPPSVRDTVTDSYLSQACLWGYNQTSIQYRNGIDWIQFYGIPVQLPDHSTKSTYTPQGPDVVAGDNDLCGYYVFPPQQIANTGANNPAGQMETDIITQYYSNVQFVYWQMLTSLPAEDVRFFLPPDIGWGGWTQPDYGSFEQSIATYTDTLTTLYNSLATNIGAAMATIAATSAQQGWVSAGEWFNTIARLQGDITDMPRDMTPKTAPPQVSSIVRKHPKAFGVGTLEYDLSMTMDAFSHWVYQNYLWRPPTLTLNGSTSAQQKQIEQASLGIIQQSNSNNSHVMDTVFQVIDQIAAMNGVWQAAVDSCAGASCFKLGVQFLKHNPIAEISGLGHANINTAYQLYDNYIVLKGAASLGSDFKEASKLFSSRPIANILAKAIGGLSNVSASTADAAGNIVGGAVVVFFTAGFLLAYFLPLIPFFRFFFGTLSWFLSLAEAIIAVPLIALAHLTPEGEGFMGEKAKVAYYFVFNIFVRPTLMIFGLIAGYLIFCFTAGLMNLLYTTAVSGAGGVSQGHFTLGRIVYSVIYVVILYLCCNKCFQLIDWLPDHAMKWMGAQGLHHAKMGSVSEVGRYMAGASGFMQNKIVSGTGAAMGSKAGAAILGAMQHNPTMAKALKGAEKSLGSMAGSLGGKDAGKAVEGLAHATNTVADKSVQALSKGGEAATALGKAGVSKLDDAVSASKEAMGKDPSGSN